MGFSSALHPDDVERVREERPEGACTQDSLSAGKPNAREGRTVSLVSRRLPADAGRTGRIIRWYATGTDIEDRRQVEEEKRNANLAVREEIDSSIDVRGDRWFLETPSQRTCAQCFRWHRWIPRF